MKREDDPPLLRLSSYQLLSKSLENSNVMKILLPKTELSQKLGLKKKKPFERNPIKRNTNSTETSTAKSKAKSTQSKVDSTTVAQSVDTPPQIISEDPSGATTVSSVANQNSTSAFTFNLDPFIGAFHALPNIFVGNPFETTTAVAAKTTAAIETNSQSQSVESSTVLKATTTEVPEEKSNSTVSSSTNSSTDASVGIAIEIESTTPPLIVSEIQRANSDETSTVALPETLSSTPLSTPESNVAVESPDAEKKNEESAPTIGLANPENAKEEEVVASRHIFPESNQDTQVSAPAGSSNSRNREPFEITRETYIPDDEITVIIENQVSSSEGQSSSSSSSSSSRSRGSHSGSSSSSSRSGSSSSDSQSEGSSSRGSNSRSNSSGSSSSSSSSGSGECSGNSENNENNEDNENNESESGRSSLNSNNENSDSNSGSSSSSSSSASGRSASSSSSSASNKNRSNSQDEDDLNAGPFLTRVFRLPWIGAPLRILHRHLQRRQRSRTQAPLFSSTNSDRGLAPLFGTDDASRSNSDRQSSQRNSNQEESNRRQSKRQAEFFVTPSPRFAFKAAKDPLDKLVPKKVKSMIERYHDETSIERAERRHQTVERMMHMATIAHHLDGYLTKRLQLSVRKLHNLLSSGEHI